MNKVTSEPFFIPIDLEASLGKIEDSVMNDADDADGADEGMACETPRTSVDPFGEGSSTSSKDAHIISPYPLSETDAERRDRQELDGAGDWTFSSGSSHQPSLAMTRGAGQQHHQEVDWVELDLIPDDAVTAEPDDFSLASAEDDDDDDESEPMVDDEDVNIELEKIEDRVSFWEVDIPAQAVSSDQQPTTIPFSVSFSSAVDTINTSEERL